MNQLNAVGTFLSESEDFAAQDLRILSGDIDAGDIGMKLALPVAKDAVVDLAIGTQGRPVIGLNYHECGRGLVEFEIRWKNVQRVFWICLKLDEHTLRIPVIPRPFLRQWTVYGHERAPLGR